MSRTQYIGESILIWKQVWKRFNGNLMRQTRIPGVKTAKAISRWIQARILGGAMILGYHRVANETQDSYGVCVTPEHFAEHMGALRKYANPISLRELVEHIKYGSLPARSIAVTFDDGYVDNLHHAKPVLELYGIPATVFVCTGYTGREFWWDEIERLIMSSEADPGTLHLRVGTNLFQWNPTTMGTDTRSIINRRKFREALYHFMLPLDMEHQDEAIKEIRKWSGLKAENSLVARAMNHQEIYQLTKGELIEVGSHTRYHPMLPNIPIQRQMEEIVQGKKDLENFLGKAVNGFAYPNGRASLDAKKIVKEAGFTYACTSLHDMVRPGSDLYGLSRFWQTNVDGERFLQALKVWMSLK